MFYHYYCVKYPARESVGALPARLDVDEKW
jgi:hypothetical protein